MKTNVKIIGNEYLRGAIEVSLAGKRSVAVIGHPGNGKESLEIILGNLITFKKPCLCGSYWI